jgi:hypothetical protein
MKAQEDTSGDSSGVAVTEAGRVSVESCYDQTSKSVKLSVEFQDIEAIPTETGMQLPWMSIGYREDEICSMTPVSGGNTELIMISQSADESFPKAYTGSMGPATKRFDQNAISAIYESFQPLDEAVGYNDVSLVAPMVGSSDGTMLSRSATPNGSVVLSFSQQFDQKPDALHLMYAIGMTATLGIHTSRSCFEIVEFPTCSSSSSDTELSFSVAESILSGSSQDSSTETESSASTAAIFVTFGSLVALVGSFYLSV